VSELGDTQRGLSDSAGAILHAERSRQSFSVGDVSRHLKLSVRQVEALERDEFQSFGGPVFVHGFLRNYAKLLGLDASLLIQAADRKLAEESDSRAGEKQQSEIVSSPVTISEGPQKSIVPLLLVAAILIAAILGWTLTREDQSPVEAVPATEVADNSDGSMARQDMAPQDEAVLMTEPGAEIAPTEPEAIITRKTAAPNPQIADGVIVLVFRQESWVEITDRYGERVYAELAPQGVSRLIEGTPPLSVVIGNAAGVDLIYNDEPVDLAPHTRVDVARVSLE